MVWEISRHTTVAIPFFNPQIYLGGWDNTWILFCSLAGQPYLVSLARHVEIIDSFWTLSILYGKKPRATYKKKGHLVRLVSLQRALNVKLCIDIPRIVITWERGLEDYLTAEEYISATSIISISKGEARRTEDQREPRLREQLYIHTYTRSLLIFFPSRL